MPNWTLPSQAASVPLARRLAIEALPGLAPESLEAVALVVSELVTNCVRHAGTEVRLMVQRRGGEVRVEVSDSGSGVPTLQHPTPQQPHGRGLQVVDSLSQTWGIVPASSNEGKTIWCALAV
jgi:signal transduction histidine kinase